MKQPKPRPQRRVRVAGIKKKEPNVKLFTLALIELAREQMRTEDEKKDKSIT